MLFKNRLLLLSIFIIHGCTTPSIQPAPGGIAYVDFYGAEENKDKGWDLWEVYRILDDGTEKHMRRSPFGRFFGPGAPVLRVEVHSHETTFIVREWDSKPPRETKVTVKPSPKTIIPIKVLKVQVGITDGYYKTRDTKDFGSYKQITETTYRVGAPLLRYQVIVEDPIDFVPLDKVPYRFQK